MESAMEPAEGRGNTLQCAHCGRDIMCGQPAAGGPPCPGQFHEASGEIACFPDKGAESPRARPVRECGCRARDLTLSAPDVPPPFPPEADGRGAVRTQEGTPGSGKERLAEVGRAFLGGTAPGSEPDVIELADGAGVCLVQRTRGGGKVYIAPDETVLFVPSSMDFDTGLAAFLNGARTPAAR
jgi:hypothetical protein